RPHQSSHRAHISLLARSYRAPPRERQKGVGARDSPRWRVRSPAERRRWKLRTILTLGPIGRTLTPFGRTSGPLERTLGPLERTLGPLERTLGPLERTLGPLERTLGPLERTLGPLERTLAWCLRQRVREPLRDVDRALRESVEP